LKKEIVEMGCSQNAKTMKYDGKNWKKCNGKWYQVTDKGDVEVKDRDTIRELEDVLLAFGS
jgi:hypothetical protein